MLPNKTASKFREISRLYIALGYWAINNDQRSISAEQLLQMFLLLRILYVGKTVVTDFRCKGIWIKEAYAITMLR